MAVFHDESIEGALDRALKNARHLRARDAAAVAVARSLARKIDAWDVIVDWALEDVAETGGKARPGVPQNDNVSAATLLKALQALGLVPPVEKQKTSPAKTPVSALDRFKHGNFTVVNGDG
ncbi:HTH DNA binding domain protein [Propionibacterium phage B3]|uniref:HTH DNA binding domain protein n=1 Tax=Propionibacterium phage B3 TaxID=1897533 RepID=A0A1D8ETI0_9CAUD|nr:DNA binding protein [Propionibacterium phage B3]AOT24296.1 HTH DNA binding domain protein [Propionibacterium phage B3]